MIRSKAFMCVIIVAQGLPYVSRAWLAVIYSRLGSEKLWPNKIDDLRFEHCASVSNLSTKKQTRPFQCQQVELISSAHVVDECATPKFDAKFALISLFARFATCIGTEQAVEQSRQTILRPPVKPAKRVCCDRYGIERLDKFCSPASSLHRKRFNRCQGSSSI